MRVALVLLLTTVASVLVSVPTADAVVPRVAIQSPANADSISSSELRLAGTAVGAVPPQAVRLSIQNSDTLEWLTDDGTWSVEQDHVRAWLTNVSPDRRTVEWEYSARLPAGDYEFAVEVRDSLLRSTVLGWRSFSVVASPDDAGPTNQIRWPFRNQVFTESSQVFAGLAEGDAGIESVTIAVRNVGDDEWLQPDGSFGAVAVDMPLTLSAPGSPIVAWSHPVELPTVGEYVAQLIATDVDGSTQRRTVPFEYMIDAPTGGPHYATLLMSRAQWVDAPACVPTVGAKTLFEVADELRGRGHSATMTVVQERPDETERTCHKNFQINASWQDLVALRSDYGWHAAVHHKDASLAELDYAEQLDATCGDLQELLDRGFDRAWGMFAYNGNKSTPEIQADPTSTCFAWGRRYGSGVNTIGEAQEPWYIRVESVNGGYCNEPAAACFDRSYTGAKLRYRMPDELVARMENRPDRYTLIQHYRFVEGANVHGPGLRFDCSAQDPRLHWTSETEVYCWNDYLLMLDAISPNTIVTDPATVAEAWGRERP